MKDFIEQKYELSLLYDFYGELLKEHHRTIFEEYFLDDLSLSEIADEQGISRQGVHDIIKRSSKMLQDYDRKLKLMDKYNSIRTKLDNASKLVDKVKEDSDFESLDKIKDIFKDIVDNYI